MEIGSTVDCSHQPQEIELHARAIHEARSSDHHFQTRIAELQGSLFHLDLSSCVEIFRNERGVLSDALACLLCVHMDTGRDDYTTDAVFLCCLQYVFCAAHVYISRSLPV